MRINLKKGVRVDGNIKSRKRAKIFYFLYNASLLTKLAFCFIVIASLIAVEGLLSLNNMNKINVNTVQMYEHNLIPINDLRTLKENSLKLSELYSNIINEKNPTKLSSLNEEIKKNIQASDQLKEKFKNNNVDANHKNLFNTYDQYFQTYKTSREQCLKALSGEDENLKIYALLKMNTDRDAMNAFLDTLIKQYISSAEETNKSNAFIYISSIKTMAIYILSGFILAIFLGIAISGFLLKQLKQVVTLADAVGNGDLSKKININSNDEIGKLAKALNEAVGKIRSLIDEAINNSSSISSSSRELSFTIQEISSSMENTNKATEEISSGAEELSASTEEIASSIEEIGTHVSELSNKAEQANKSSGQIQNRAADIKEKARMAREKGNTAYNESYERITKAMEEGKVIKEIEVLIETIKNISSQTELLALNAAIEAARAGEHGRGFSVVADEVRKLAEQSSSAVTNIQNIINQVVEAFNNLSESGHYVLNFIDNEVKPSYDLLLSTGFQYEKDAEYLNSMATDIATSTKLMSESISQLSSVIQDVSAITQQSASNSESILENVKDTTSSVIEFSKAIHTQAKISEDLMLEIKRFKV